MDSNSTTNQKPIMFVRPPRLENMGNPLYTAWNQALATKTTKADSTINLAQLVDFSQMNDVFASYLEVIGLPVAIVDLKGLVLASSNWQRLCLEFHRTHPGTLTRCLESDTSLSRQMEEGKDYTIYRCRNGLTDCASPIIVEGQHIANLFIGQFFLNTPDHKRFEAQCAQFGFDRDSYFQALAEVPVVEEEKIPAILRMLVGFANQIAKQSIAEHRARMAYESVEKQIVERTQLLSEALEFNETILLNFPLPMGVYAATGQCVLANDAKVRLLGASREALLAQNFHSISSWRQSGLFDECLRALADHSPRRGEIHAATSFGKEVWLEYQITPVKLQGEDHLLIQYVDQTDRKKLEQELRHYAFHDSLTNLPNRRMLMERIAQAQCQQCYGAVLFLDLNRFKQLNDIHGHEVGDHLLIEVARRLQSLIREQDTIARIGGDEFVVLLEELGSDPDGAMERASIISGKIQAALSAEYVLGDIRHRGSACVGIKLFFGKEADAERILREADAAMYEEKKSTAR